MKVTLTMFPDGRGIINVDPDVSQSDVIHLRKTWEWWRKTPEAVLIIPGPVLEATSVTIDLPTELPPSDPKLIGTEYHGPTEAI